MAYPSMMAQLNCSMGSCQFLCIILRYVLVYLNTCPLKQKLYGASTITNQDTIHTAPWGSNEFILSPTQLLSSF